LNRKYFDNFSFINFIYVIKVYFILFLLIYFIKVYIILFLIIYLFYLLFFMHLLIILSYKTLKLKSISNELWKGWKLAWYHHFIHIACARKLRGLRQKLDALRVQNGQSLSKYQDFIRKLVCYKGISFFKTYLNSWLCVCSKCTIRSHIIIFQSVLTSFVIFQAFTYYFEQ
jgi:hypothetical protein